MSNLKKFGVVLVAVFALTAIAASSASAQLFTASNANEVLTGMSTSPQVFNTTTGSNLNKVTCNTANVTGVTAGTAVREQTVNVHYNSGWNDEPTSKSPIACNAFIGTANISLAHYIFKLVASNADMNLDTGNVEIVNPINISTSVGCNVQVPKQTVGTVTFEHDSASSKAMNVTANVNGINSTGNGGLCGNTHNTGSYVGNTTVDSNSTITFDITG